MTTPPPVDEQLLADAIAYAGEAATLTLEWFQSTDLAIDRKQDGSEVTVADRSAEELVRTHLAQHYPDDAIIGEEHGNAEGTSGRTWVLDPIDGTTSFVRGVPLYSSLLAVQDEHGPAVGVVNIPALGLSLTAGRGRGAHLNGHPTSVNDVDDMAHGIISSSAFDLGWWPEAALVAVAGSDLKTRTWGDGYGYLLVATGQIEAMTDPWLNAWDIAPMLTVIPEAGGRITQWDGSTHLNTGPWLATNGHLHDPILGLVNPQ